MQGNFIKDEALLKEIKRKAIHFSSICYPLLYWLFLDKYQISVTLLILLGLIFIWDCARIFGFLPFTYFFSLLREHELKDRNFSGAFNFLLASLLVIVMFEKDIALLSLFILTTCDTTAALVGKKWGKHKIQCLQKSWEGFLAYNISGVIVIIIFVVLYYNKLLWHYLLAYFVALIFSSFGELFAKRINIDDNLLISLIFSITSYIFLTIM